MKDHLHQLPGNTVHSAAQNTVSIPFSEGMLLAHVQPGVYQDPNVLFCQAALQLCGPQYMLVPGVVPSQMQDFARLVEHHEVLVSPFF